VGFARGPAGAPPDAVGGRGTLKLESTLGVVPQFDADIVK
jgi:hypothetical protein